MNRFLPTRLLATLAVIATSPALALDESAISSSDDYQKHKAAFQTASRSLISNGICSEADFREVGGWVRSTTFPGRSVYFTYCGGFHTRNRLYLDVRSGEVFR